MIFEVIFLSKIGICVVLIAYMNRKVLESQIGYNMNIQIIYDETEFLIHIDANDSDLPALYNREPVSKHLGCRVRASECDRAEQSKAQSKKSPFLFPKGTTEGGVIQHWPTVFDNSLYHKQYWDISSERQRKVLSQIISVSQLKSQSNGKTILGNSVL